MKTGSIMYLCNFTLTGQKLSLLKRRKIYTEPTDFICKCSMITETSKKAFLSHIHTIFKISRGNKGPGGSIAFVCLKE